MVFHLEVAKPPVWVTVVRKHVFQLFVKITMYLHASKSPYCFVQNKRFVLPISRHSCYVPSSSNPMSHQCTISFKAACLYHLSFWVLWKTICSFSNNGVMNPKQLKRYHSFISFSITISKKKSWRALGENGKQGKWTCCIIPTQFLPSGLWAPSAKPRIAIGTVIRERAGKMLPQRFTAANLELILKTSKGVWQTTLI